MLPPALLVSVKVGVPAFESMVRPVPVWEIVPELVRLEVLVAMVTATVVPLVVSVPPPSTIPFVGKVCPAVTVWPLVTVKSAAKLGDRNTACSAITMGSCRNVDGRREDV